MVHSKKKRRWHFAVKDRSISSVFSAYSWTYVIKYNIKSKVSYIQKKYPNSNVKTTRSRTYTYKHAFSLLRQNCLASKI